MEIPLWKSNELFGYMQIKRTNLRNWKLEISENNKGLLIYKNKVVHTFPNTWSEKFAIFHYLFENSLAHWPYKELYEHSFGRKYPRQGKRKVINQSMRRNVYYLKKSLQNLPITIKIINRGASMTIQDKWK